jgi:cobalt-zinc-cadmium efflux system outer membrane protein
MTRIMVTRWALVAGMMATLSASALAQDRTAISLDRLTQDVITNDPERQFYQRQIETAGTEARAAGRWADSEMVVEFGERRADDRLSGAPIGEGQTHAVSAVQPIEFGGRIALRRAIADRQIGLARIGLQQFDATLTAQARSLGYGMFAADEKADVARTVAARVPTTSLRSIAPRIRSAPAEWATPTTRRWSTATDAASTFPTC